MRGNTYGRPPREKEPVFPRELAVLIVQKACRMAERFENETIDQMTRRELRDGFDPALIARQMEL